MEAWHFIRDKHLAGVNTVLLYVLHSEGSSPGRQGFKMAVAADGEFSGTIGGGIMEHKFVELAKARLRDAEIEPSIHRQVHDKSAGNNQSGMICSGEQTIFFYLVRDNDLQQIQDLLSSIDANLNGTLTLSSSGILFSNVIPFDDYEFKEIGNNKFIYREKTGFKNRLVIIGGGHCCLALCRIMNHMDFHIQVFEERAGLNTLEQNHFAHEKRLVNTYQELDGLVEEAPNVYVVIMTFGYRTDDVALKALAGKKFKYLGMLGSRKKVEKMFAGQDGRSALQNIFSPIGIQIKSRTAGEIAVSIAAQIIEVKNKDQ